MGVPESIPVRGTIRHGKPWDAVRTPSTLPLFPLIGPLPVGAADEATPQSLFGLLKAAHEVRRAGPASGPGWAGTTYTFSYSGGHGTVAIDRQGRVRELDFSIMVFQSASKLRLPPGFTGTISMTFGALRRAPGQGDRAARQPGLLRAGIITNAGASPRARVPRPGLAVQVR